MKRVLPILQLILLPTLCYPQANAPEEFYTLKIWDALGTGSVTGIEYYPSVVDFVITPDNKLLALTKENNVPGPDSESTRGMAPVTGLSLDWRSLVVFRWDEMRYVKDSVLLTFVNSDSEIRLSENGDYLALVDKFSTTLLDTRSLEVIGKYDLEESASTFDFVRSDQVVIYTSLYFKPSLLKIFSFTDSSEVSSKEIEKYIHSIRVNSSRLFYSTQSEFGVMDVESLDVLDSIHFENPIRDFQILSSGNICVITSSDQAEIIDGKTLTTVRKISLKEKLPQNLAISPDESYMAISAFKGIRIYDFQDGTLINEMTIPEFGDYHISNVRFDEDKVLYSKHHPKRGDLMILSIGIGQTANTIEAVLDGDTIATGKTIFDVPTPAKDAQNFTRIFAEANIGRYENINPYLLINETATFNNIESIYGHITSLNTNYEFTFFYSGETYFIEDNPYLLAYDTRVGIDSATNQKYILNAVSKNDVETYQWSSDFVVIDASRSEALIENYKRSAGVRGAANPGGIFNNAFILTLAEDSYAYDTEEGSLLTKLLLSGISGKADLFCPGDLIINSAELEAYLSVKASSDGRIQPKIFSGMPFDVSLAKNNEFNDLDIEPPKINVLNTLPDTVVAISKYKIELEVTDNEGVNTVNVNGEEIQPYDKNRYLSEVLLKHGTNVIRIEATDIRKNITVDSVTIFRDTPVKGPRNFALFIATNQYDGEKWTDLKNPIRDAEAIAAELSVKFGFDTTIVRNPTVDEIELALRKTIKREYTKDDQLFVFIAGHGYLLHEEGFMVAKNSDGELGSKYFPFSRLSDMLTKHPSDHIFLTIDVCQSGSFFEPVATSKRRSETRGATLANAEEQQFTNYVEKRRVFKTRAALTSSGLEDVYDGDEHSPFAKELIRLLRNTQSGQALTISNVENAVKMVEPFPILGSFSGDEPGSDFFFIAK